MTATTGQSTTGPHSPTCPGSPAVSAATLALSASLREVVWRVIRAWARGEITTLSSAAWPWGVSTGLCAKLVAGGPMASNAASMSPALIPIFTCTSSVRFLQPGLPD